MIVSETQRVATDEMELLYVCIIAVAATLGRLAILCSRACAGTTTAPAGSRSRVRGYRWEVRLHYSVQGDNPTQKVPGLLPKKSSMQCGWSSSVQSALLVHGWKLVEAVPL